MCCCSDSTTENIDEIGCNPKHTVQKRSDLVNVSTLEPKFSLMMVTLAIVELLRCSWQVKNKVSISDRIAGIGLDASVINVELEVLWRFRIRWKVEREGGQVR